MFETLVSGLIAGFIGGFGASYANDFKKMINRTIKHISGKANTKITFRRRR